MPTKKRDMRMIATQLVDPVIIGLDRKVSYAITWGNRSVTIHPQPQISLVFNLIVTLLQRYSLEIKDELVNIMEALYWM